MQHTGGDLPRHQDCQTILASGKEGSRTSRCRTSRRARSSLPLDPLRIGRVFARGRNGQLIRSASRLVLLVIASLQRHLVVVGNRQIILRLCRLRRCRACRIESQPPRQSRHRSDAPLPDRKPRRRLVVDDRRRAQLAVSDAFRDNSAAVHRDRRDIREREMIGRQSEDELTNSSRSSSLRSSGGRRRPVVPGKAAATADLRGIGETPLVECTSQAPYGAAARSRAPACWPSQYFGQPARPYIDARVARGRSGRGARVTDSARQSLLSAAIGLEPMLRAGSAASTGHLQSGLPVPR